MMDQASLIARLQAEITANLAPVGLSGPFALLDFPDHANVGDSAIWAGEIEYFKKVHGARPAYVSSFRNLDIDELNAECPEGVVFIHGGGNFGDVWAHHQKFRLELFERLKGRRLVQLPQSIHFSSEGSIVETARAIEAHGEVTLYVRDRESLAFAQQRFQCESVLCPDLAFFIGQIQAQDPIHDVLMLLRTDRESAAGGSAFEARPGIRVADWLDENATLARITKARGYLSAVSIRRGRRAAYDLVSRRRVRRGCRLLASGATVVTDRLHAHILSLLLGIPHAVLDNSYGKIARFSDCWTHDADLSFRAESQRQALEWAASEATVKRR